MKCARLCSLLGLVAIALVCGELWARARGVADDDFAASSPANSPVAALRDYRGPAFERARDPRVMRVIVLGDDSAHSSSAPVEHAWPRLLELEFARDGTASRVEVLDFSERAGNAARAVELLRGSALDLEPTLLVVSLGVLDARRPFARASHRGLLEHSALWRTLAREASVAKSEALLRESISRSEFAAVRERSVFDFGVQLAQLIELARSRHVRVALVRVPYPWRDTTELARELASMQSLRGEDAAALLHGALLAELDRIAELTGTIRVDACELVARHREFMPTPGQWSDEGAAALALRLHSELRPRLR